MKEVLVIVIVVLISTISLLSDFLFLVLPEGGVNVEQETFEGLDIISNPVPFIANFTDNIPDLNESGKEQLNDLIINSLYGGGLTSDEISSLINDIRNLISNASPLTNATQFLKGIEDSAVLSVNETRVYSNYFETITSKKINEVFESEDLIWPCSPYITNHYYGDEALKFIGLKPRTSVMSSYLRIGVCVEGVFKLIHVKPIDSGEIIMPPECGSGANISVINGRIIYSCVGECSVNTSSPVKGDYYMLALNDFNCSNLEMYTNYSFYLLSKII